MIEKTVSKIVVKRAYLQLNLCTLSMSLTYPIQLTKININLIIVITGSSIPSSDSSGRNAIISSIIIIASMADESKQERKNFLRMRV